MKQILILAGDSDKNIGDNGILSAMCQEFIQNNRDIQIGILSSSHFFSDKFPGNVHILAKGIKNFVSLLCFAANSEMIVCGGGGLFQDDDSRVKMPYWGLKLALFRLFCPRITGYSIGAGPLSYPLSQKFAKLAFSTMEKVSVRDTNALQSCKGLTKKPIDVLPDPALVLNAAPRTMVREFLQNHKIPSKRKLLGVTIRRWFHHVEGTWIPHKYAEKYHLRAIPDPTEYREMIALLAKALDQVIDATDAYIVFLPTYNSSQEADDQTCQAIMDSMHQATATSLLYIEDPELYKGVAGELDGMFASRMHPLIFAASVGTSVMGMSYNQKFDGFFSLIDAGENLFNIREFVQNKDVEQLCSDLCTMLKGDKPVNNERIRQLQAKIRDNNKNLIHSL
jgi:polysaccharide pyruvyl transferase WcaK-like protein